MNPIETLRWIAAKERRRCRRLGLDPGSSLVRRRALMAAWKLRGATETIHEDLWTSADAEAGQLEHEYDQTQAKAIELLRNERLGFMLVTFANTPPRVRDDGLAEILTVHSYYVHGNRHAVRAFWTRVKEISAACAAEITTD